MLPAPKLQNASKNTQQFVLRTIANFLSVMVPTGALLPGGEVRALYLEVERAIDSLKADMSGMLRAPLALPRLLDTPTVPLTAPNTAVFLERYRLTQTLVELAHAVAKVPVGSDTGGCAVALSGVVFALDSVRLAVAPICAPPVCFFLDPSYNPNVVRQMVRVLEEDAEDDDETQEPQPLKRLKDYKCDELLDELEFYRKMWEYKQPEDHLMEQYTADMDRIAALEGELERRNSDSPTDSSLRGYLDRLSDCTTCRHSALSCSCSQ